MSCEWEEEEGEIVEEVLPYVSFGCPEHECGFNFRVNAFNFVERLNGVAGDDDVRMSVMFGDEFGDFCCWGKAFDFDVELAFIFCELDDLFCGWDGLAFYFCAEGLELFEGVVRYFAFAVGCAVESVVMHDDDFMIFGEMSITFNHINFVLDGMLE